MYRPPLHIYKIVSSSCDLVYIGQTSSSLNDRFAVHRSSQNSCSSRRIFEQSASRDDVTCELICIAYDPEYADELEKFWILHTPFVCNRNIPLGTDSKADRMRVASKKYVSNNREKWNAYMRQRYAEKKIHDRHRKEGAMEGDTTEYEP